jgi:hypothetical protein
MNEPKVGDRVGFWSTRYPGHLSHGKVLDEWNGCVFVQIKGSHHVSYMSMASLVYDNMSDADAAADFLLVGEQVQMQRADLMSQVTALDRMLTELPASSVIERLSLECRKQEVLDELAGKAQS